MKTKLLYHKIFILLNGFLLVLIPNNSHAQDVTLNSPLVIIENVVPNANETTIGGSSFTGMFHNSQFTCQFLISESQLINLINKHLVSIAFRSTSGPAPTQWPTVNTVYNNYDIYLSGSVNPANRSFTFSENVVGVQTQVRSGSLEIPIGALTVGSTPNNFYDINFTTPWLYTGGNLLIEIRHDGSSGTSKGVDATYISSPGYGSLYSFCYALNYAAVTNAVQGTFGVVDIKADESLHIIDQNLNNISVYPNPTSEYLFVESNTEVSKISIFNMLGQMVFCQNYNNKKVCVSLAQLNSGTYLLSIENEFGIEAKKIIKN